MDKRTLNRRFSVAPMLDWTDRHCRTFHRKMTKHTVLYTEMITTGAILFGRGDYLHFNQHEGLVALQLGGSIRKRQHSVPSLLVSVVMMK